VGTRAASTETETPPAIWGTCRQRLFVTGGKDLIILAAQLSPQDIRRAAAVEACGAGCRRVRDRKSLATEVVIVAEASRRAPRRSRGLIGDPRGVRDQVGITVRDIVLVEAGVIPKTTSGKPRRAECRAQLERGTLRPLHPPAAGVLVRAGAFALMPVWLQRVVERAGTMIHQVKKPRSRP
jgi:acyl-CoA synthetase (AMP-forming)/AMP-acid ligase II